jgi:hypothetical protein
MCGVMEIEGSAHQNDHRGRWAIIIIIVATVVNKISTKLPAPWSNLLILRVLGARAAGYREVCLHGGFLRPAL